MSLKPGERPRNSKGHSYHVLAVRPLTEADLPALREKSAPWARIKAMRDSYHQVARLMASGLKNTQIAEATGYALFTISRFRNDPAMQDQVARYREMLDEDWREEQDQISRQSLSAITKGLRTIHDHFDDADERGELVPMNRALSVVSDLMDRFGYGKKSANLNVNVNYAAELEAAIHRTNSLKKVAAE